jgi:hypothetical protein
MRWEDERYVRVYTRDTGDWLALSFEAQALFLMLLRKVDRIGELHLGKRGKAAVAACIGHPTKVLSGALDELLADGCVRLKDSGERLFIPNFLKAQETPKSPTERKREQRERDAAKARESTEMSRDVTPVTNGHEMSPRAVPCRTVPPVPNQTELPIAADKPPPVRKRKARLEDERPPDPRLKPLIDSVVATAKTAGHGFSFSLMGGAYAKALSEILEHASPDEIVQRWARALRRSDYPTVRTPLELKKHWEHFAADSPKRQDQRAQNPDLAAGRHDDHRCGCGALAAGAGSDGVWRCIGCYQDHREAS